MVGGTGGGMETPLYSLLSKSSLLGDLQANKTLSQSMTVILKMTAEAVSQPFLPHIYTYACPLNRNYYDDRDSAASKINFCK